MRIVIAIAAVLLAGCGSEIEAGESLAERGRSATAPYDGPLEVGAAGAALECGGEMPFRRGEGSYDDGLAEVQASAEAALDEYIGKTFPIYSVPSDGYAVEREQDGRVLFSYDVHGRTKVAVLAAHGVRDAFGDEGWGVRAWAQCDPSELPAEVTDDLGIGVWADESGRRVPVTRIQSFQGAEHCEWTDIRFVLVGPEDTADWYVRDTSGGDFSGLLRATFAREAALPEGATDTGLRRAGRRLWIGPEKQAAYLVSLDDAQDVERWPAATQPLRCA